MSIQYIQDAQILTASRLQIASGAQRQRIYNDFLSTLARFHELASADEEDYTERTSLGDDFGSEKALERGQTIVDVLWMKVLERSLNYSRFIEITVLLSMQRGKVATLLSFKLRDRTLTLLTGTGKTQGTTMEYSAYQLEKDSWISCLAERYM